MQASMDRWEVSVSKKKSRHQQAASEMPPQNPAVPKATSSPAGGENPLGKAKLVEKEKEKEKVTAGSLIPCRFYRAGSCTAGKSCQFAHVKEDQSSLICKFYVKGTCKFGSKCAHLHVGPTELDAEKANYRKLMLGPRPDATTIVNFSAPTDIIGAGGDHRFEGLKSSSPSLLSISPLHSTASVWSVSSPAHPSSPGRASSAIQLSTPTGESPKANGFALYPLGTASPLPIDGSQTSFGTVALDSKQATFSSLSEQLRKEALKTNTVGAQGSSEEFVRSPNDLITNKSDDDIDFNLLPSSLNELLVPSDHSDEEEPVMNRRSYQKDEDMFGNTDTPGYLELHSSSPPDSFVLGIRPNQIVRSEEAVGALSASSATTQQHRRNGSGSTTSWALLPNTHAPNLNAPLPAHVSDGDFPSLKSSTTKPTTVPANLTFARVAKSGLVTNEQEDQEETVDLSLEPLCPYAMVGKCRYGEYCRNLHGLQCPYCGKFVLHPYNVDENEAHLRDCAPKQRSNIDSWDVECAICYEKVLSKKDGRFGILSCDHPFCLNCIRSWRLNTSQDNAVTHSCPVCRTPSYFITPSVDWVMTGERKTELINEYKAKLARIPCKHFNYGEGTCPFGTSCFYSHVRKDGTRDVVQLRKYLNGEEEVKIMNQVKLFDFIDAFDQQRSGAGR